MSSSEEWSIPLVVQPRPENHSFDLDRTLAGVVQLRAEIPADAFTASILGTERQGSAVLLEGARLAVTIGYLVTEADRVWLTAGNAVVEAHVLGVDFPTGFGLLLLLGSLGLPGIPIGSTKHLRPGDSLIIAAGGGRKAALQTRLLAKQEFAGYWEYLLDEALYTAPAHPHWGGTACIGPDGKLVGIGSLLMQAEIGAEKSAGANMIVPLDLLPPIMDDLQRRGRANRPPRPWLGFYATEIGDSIIVTGLAPNGPAAKAGIEEGDTILAVAGREVSGLSELWRAIWAMGEVGVTVPLSVGRSGRKLEIDIVSADRDQFLKQPKLH